MQYLVNKNIARLIQEKGIKQRELADRIGVSKQVISNIIQCKRSVYVEEAIDIARALGVGLEEVFAGAW